MMIGQRKPGNAMGPIPVAPSSGDGAARIERLHRELLSALGVPYFPPGMQDQTAWAGFLFVLDTLQDTPGGPLRPSDMRKAVELMRKQNREGRAGWALRFTNIIRDPEMFRDLVLETRRNLRPRPAPVETTTERGGVSRLEMTDPVVDEDRAKHIREHADQFWQSMGGRPGEKP